MNEKYEVKTISLIPPRRVMNDYYAGSCRKEAVKTLRSLKKRGINKIELIDIPNGYVYQYILKNRLNEYRVIKTRV